MKRLDRNYLSFFEWLGLRKLDPNRPQNYSYHGFRYHDGSEDNPIVIIKDPKLGDKIIYPLYQFLGAFTPLAKVVKDSNVFFRPYDSKEQLYNDLTQPLNGIANCLKGVISLLGGLLLVLGWLIVLPFLLLGSCIPYVDLVSLPLLGKIIYPLSWMFEGICDEIHGVMQIVFTPLTYLLKLPIRSILTYCQIQPNYAEQKPRIKRLATEALKKLGEISPNEKPLNFENNKARVLYDSKDPSFFDEKPIYESSKQLTKAIGELASLLYEIQRKYSKSVRSGWKTNLDTKTQRQEYVITFSAIQKLARGMKPEFTDSKIKATDLNSPAASQTSQSLDVSYQKMFSQGDGIENGPNISNCVALTKTYCMRFARTE